MNDKLNFSHQIISILQHLKITSWLLNYLREATFVGHNTNSLDTRSGPTLGCTLFRHSNGILKKEFFWKSIFWKKSADNKNHENFPEHTMSEIKQISNT